MAITRLEIIQHVLTILDTVKEGQPIFLVHGNSLLRKIIITMEEA